MSQLLLIADAPTPSSDSSNTKEYLCNTPLTPEECFALDQLSLELTAESVVDVISSPTQRSLQIARRIALPHGISIARDPRLDPLFEFSELSTKQFQDNVWRNSVASVLQALQDNPVTGCIVLVTHPLNAKLIIEHFASESNVIDPRSLAGLTSVAILDFHQNITCPTTRIKSISNHAAQLMSAPAA